MMTTTDRLTALDQIEKGIMRDLDNRPNFTLTRTQLFNRIADYLDDAPHATTDDIDAIYSTALIIDLPIRD